MAKVPVFYSFHFDNDVMCVQQIRNMGMIDGNEPVSKNDRETKTMPTLRNGSTTTRATSVV